MIADVDARREYQREWRKRRIARGLCCKCNAAHYKAGRCAEHYARELASNKVRSQERTQSGALVEPPTFADFEAGGLYATREHRAPRCAYEFADPVPGVVARAVARGYILVDLEDVDALPETRMRHATDSGQGRHP